MKRVEKWATVMAEADLTILLTGQNILNYDRCNKVPATEHAKNVARFNLKRAEIKTRLVKAYLAEVGK